MWRFNGTRDFDPSANSFFLTAQNTDAFILKLNTLGTFVWAKNFGGPDDQYAREIHCEGNSKLYVSVVFKGTADFDPSSSTYNVTSLGGWDSFVSKYSVNGNLFWALGYGSSTNDYEPAMTFEDNNSLLLSSSFSDTLDVDPSIGIHNLISAGQTDVYLAKFTQCQSASITTDSISACNSFTSPSGKYTWTTSGTYNDTLVNLTGCDSVVQIALTITQQPIVTDTLNACKQFVSPTGNYTWTNSGVYYDTIPSGSACDTVLIFNLTIDTVNVGVTNASPTLTANATNATYQWLDCSTGPISGASGQSFTATANGQYAVIVTQNGCIDTSDCFAVNNISLAEAPLTAWNLYPNPSDGIIHIVSNQQKSIFSVYVTDLVGNVLTRPIFIDGSAYRLELPTQSGVYFVCIKGQNGETHFYKVIRL